MDLRAWALGLTLSLLLSGCSGSSAAQEKSQDEPSATVVASGEPLPDAGSIEGVVVDDSNAPIQGATVAVEELGLQASTDVGGAFAFSNLAPGTYAIHALALGYQSAAKRATVEANEVTNVLFTLTSIAVQEPYVEMLGPFNAFFSCAVGTPVAITGCGTAATNPVLFPNDKVQMKFKISSKEWQTFVGESRWQQSSYATAPGMAIWLSRDNRTNNHWWCEADGRSPIKFRYEKELDSVCTSKGNGATDKPELKHMLFIAADPGFGGTSTENPPVRILLQQKYELLMSIFYYEPAPLEYTGFPDG